MACDEVYRITGFDGERNVVDIYETYFGFKTEEATGKHLMRFIDRILSVDGVVKAEIEKIEPTGG